MNGAAQAELSALSQLCGNIASDLNGAWLDLDGSSVTDLDIANATSEWKLAVQSATSISGITAYLWPTWQQLAAPSTFAAAGDVVYLIANSGVTYQYDPNASSTTWKMLPDYSLSVVAAGCTVAAIDGAPVTGTSVGPDYGQTFYLKTYDDEANAWRLIPALHVLRSQLTVKGGSGPLRRLWRTGKFMLSSMEIGKLSQQCQIKTRQDILQFAEIFFLQLPIMAKKICGRNYQASGVKLAPWRQRPLWSLAVHTWEFWIRMVCRTASASAMTIHSWLSRLTQ